MWESVTLTTTATNNRGRRNCFKIITAIGNNVTLRYINPRLSPFILKIIVYIFSELLHKVNNVHTFVNAVTITALISIIIIRNIITIIHYNRLTLYPYSLSSTSRLSRPVAQEFECDCADSLAHVIY